MTKSNKYLILVNKFNKFDKSMIKDFKFVETKDSDGKTYMVEDAYLALQELEQYMSKKHLIAVSKTSIYRTHEQQQATLDYYIKKDGEVEANKRVAKPGYSEHHTGLAIDVGVHKIHFPIEQNFYDYRLLKKVANRLVKQTKEEEEAMFKVLHSELSNFGFILRYPEDKKDITGVEFDEPWHIRYVGVENAKEMERLGMCLEEYVAHLKAQETSIN